MNTAIILAATVYCVFAVCMVTGVVVLAVWAIRTVFF